MKKPKKFPFLNFILIGFLWGVVSIYYINNFYVNNSYKVGAKIIFFPAWILSLNNPITYEAAKTLVVFSIIIGILLMLLIGFLYHKLKHYEVK